MAYLGNTPADRFATYKYQDLTGGSGTSFTLDHPSTTNGLRVVINNVIQEPTESYSVSGTALTLTGSVSTTDDFYVVFLEQAILTATHPSTQALSATDGTFTGNVSITGTTSSTGAITATAGIIVPNGQGIDFSATSDGSGTMSSELLDDYEEGTWTPTVNVGSVSPSRASYVKIGKMVTVQANLGDITNYSSTSDVVIGGLPYATSNSPENQSMGSCMVRFVAKSNALQLNTISSTNGSTVTFYWSFNNNTTWDGLRYADASAEWDLIFSITYEAA